MIETCDVNNYKKSLSRGMTETLPGGQASGSIQKAAPASGEKLRPGATEIREESVTYFQFEATDRRCHLSQTPIWIITTETACERALFPQFPIVSRRKPCIPHYCHIEASDAWRNKWTTRPVSCSEQLRLGDSTRFIINQNPRAVDRNRNVTSV
jgi:hypothetical protein